MKTRMKKPLRPMDASDETTPSSATIAADMRDYADRWRANGTRVPGDVLERWAEFVEGQRPSQRPGNMTIKIVNNVYWHWEVVGKSGTEVARSCWVYSSEKSCLRTVRRLFGPSVKVEVVK